MMKFSGQTTRTDWPAVGIAGFGLIIKKRPGQFRSEKAEKAAPNRISAKAVIECEVFK